MRDILTQEKWEGEEINMVANDGESIFIDVSYRIYKT